MGNGLDGGVTEIRWAAPDQSRATHMPAWTN